MNGKVVEVEGDDTGPGSKVVMWDKRPGTQARQLWYYDARGFMRSAFNDLTCFTKDAGQGLKTILPSDNMRAMWKFDGNKVINQAGEVLDIRGAKKPNGTEVTSYAYNGQSNQLWKQEFV